MAKDTIGGAVWDGLVAAAARAHHLALVTCDRRAQPAYDALGVTYLLLLLLVRHSLQLPASRWSAIRGRAPRIERPGSVRLPDYPFPLPDREHQCFQRCRDHLTHTVAGGTLFLVGSRAAFELESGPVRAVAEDWPAQIARSKKTLRLQEEITAGRGSGARLAIWNCDQHCSSPRGRP